MGFVEQQGFAKTLVHIVDREGDKLLHLRRFVRCSRTFIIRANDVRRVEHEGQSRLLEEVEAQLENQFKFSRQIQYKGKKAFQYVAETSLVLRQPARLYRRRGGRLVQRNIAGRPVCLRLILAQVRDRDGRVLETWRLWSNLEPEVEASTVALWYYWRWRVESFFKLLKRAGQHLEQWQQENAERIARRLLVAVQACVIIWSLLSSDDPQDQALCQFLVRLSGRIMKPGVKATAPAVFSGMMNLLAIADALDQHPVAEIRQMAQHVSRILGLADSTAEE
jgi:IS4 transposase